MRVIRDRSGEYGDCAYEYLHLEEWADDNNEEVLFYGYATAYNNQVLTFFRDSSRKVYFQGEQPCGLYSTRPDIIKQSLEVADYFDEIYSTCPYSAEWMNLINGYDKYRPIIFPHNLDWAVKEEHERPLDVIYWGNVPNQSKTVLNILDTIIKFKYAFYTLGIGVPSHIFPHVTGVNTRRVEMWEALKRSKVMVTANLLYLTEGEVAATKSCPRWKENEAFCRVDEKIMPQIKTRPIEAIFNKTLVVLKEDPWRIFDKWFEPETEFLYYKNDEDLEPLLRDISNNWDSYKHIAENAYEKATKLYSTEKVFKTILEKRLF